MMYMMMYVMYVMYVYVMFRMKYYWLVTYSKLLWGKKNNIKENFKNLGNFNRIFFFFYCFRYFVQWGNKKDRLGIIFKLCNKSIKRKKRNKRIKSIDAAQIQISKSKSQIPNFFLKCQIPNSSAKSQIPNYFGFGQHL
jgi:hypothetical protein